VVSPSIRLKSYRQGQQLVEYLTLYARQSGQPREQLAAAVEAFLSFKRTLNKQNEADAGTTTYDIEAAQRMQALRHRLGEYLGAHHPKPEKQLVTTIIRTETKPREVLKLGPR
jgi:hypothetical protein